MLFFDKSNKQSTKIETAVTLSKSNLNMLNIHEEKYHQFLDVHQSINQTINTYHHYWCLSPFSVGEGGRGGFISNIMVIRPKYPQTHRPVTRYLQTLSYTILPKTTLHGRKTNSYMH